MIGGEAAEQAALARRHVEDGAQRGERDPHGLGWVVDWLYGDAVLPPMPLPRDPEPLPLPRRRSAIPAPDAAPSAPAEPRKHRSRRRARQLALL